MINKVDKFDENQKWSIRIVMRGFVFFLILCLALALFSHTFRFKFDDGILQVDQFYELQNNVVDVLVLGSSHAYAGISPAELFSEFGIASYNLGASSQPLWNTFHYLEEALKTQSPEVVVLDAYNVNITFEYSDPSRIIKNNFGLGLSRNKWESLSASAPTGEFADYFFQFYQYHSRYTDINAADFQSKEYYADFKGFAQHLTTVPFERPDISEVVGMEQLTEKTETYYKKIMELCKDEGIPLEIVVSPYAVTEIEQKRYNAAADIAEMNGIPFTNYNVKYEELGLDFSSDMADAGHLNYMGIEKYTKHLGGYLEGKYSLPDRRGDQRWASWDENAIKIRAQIADFELAQIVDRASYFEILASNPDFLIAGFVVGEIPEDAKPELARVLDGIGYPEAAVEIGSRWVLDIGQSPVFVTGAPALYHQLGSHMVDFSKPDGIMVDRSMMAVPESEVNIIVYDRITDCIVDSIGLDADDGFALRRI